MKNKKNLQNRKIFFVVLVSMLFTAGAVLAATQPVHCEIRPSNYQVTNSQGVPGITCTDRNGQHQIFDRCVGNTEIDIQYSCVNDLCADTSSVLNCENETSNKNWCQDDIHTPGGFPNSLCMYVGPLQNNPTTSVSPATSSATTAPMPSSDNTAGVPLCEEAQHYWSAGTLKDRGYSDPAAPTKLRKDENYFTTDFITAISDYNAEHKDAPAHTSVTPFGMLPAAVWLSTQGGLVNANSEAFVFNTPSPEVAKAKSALAKQIIKLKNTDPAKAGQLKEQYTALGAQVAGTEPALYKAIIDESKNLQRKLTPGDVLKLALEQMNGDVRQALLLAHNTLRSAARAGDGDYTGVLQDTDLFNNSLEQIRGGIDKDFSGDTVADAQNKDNAGPWYHLFGTSYFEMQSRGDMSGLPMLLELSQLPSEITNDLYNGLPLDRTGASRFANRLEQLIRSNGGIDPEKFCINVWGARIGQSLLALMRPQDTTWGTIGAQKPGMNLNDTDNIDPQHTGLAQGTAILNPNPQNTSANPLDQFFDNASTDPEKIGGQKLVIWSVHSPVNIQWRGDSGTMILDQQTQSLSGSYPALVIPFYEDQTKNWGAFWIDLATEPYTLTFTGSETGTMHLSRIDEATGQEADYIVPVVEGSTFQTIAEPDIVAPGLTDIQNNSKILPVVAGVSANGTSGNIIWFVIIIVIIIGLYVYGKKKYPEKTDKAVKAVWKYVKIISIKIYRILKIILVKLFELSKMAVKKIAEAINARKNKQ